MERELRAMTAQMNEMHEETFPKLRESLGDFGADLRRTLKTQASSRRAFLVGGGTLLGAVALAACSDGASPGSSGTSATTTPSVMESNVACSSDVLCSRCSRALRSSAISVRQGRCSTRGSCRGTSTVRRRAQTPSGVPSSPKTGTTMALRRCSGPPPSHSASFPARAPLAAATQAPTRKLGCCRGAASAHDSASPCSPANR